MLRRHLWGQLSSIDLLSMHHVPAEMDLVMSGGGFLGYYLVGVDRVLRKLCREEKLVIRRYAGTSVGALASVAMVCELGDGMIGLYDQLQGTPDFFPRIRAYFLAVLPDDAYQKCTGRVHIAISRLDWKYGVLPRLVPMVVSSFRDNEDLVEACMASCSVPYFVSSTLFYRFRGHHCMDGYFTKNVVIPEYEQRPQLVVRLHHIPYSWWTVFTPYEHMVLPLIVQGALETELLFHRPPQQNARVGALEWHSSSSSASALTAEPVPIKKRRAVALFFQKAAHQKPLAALAVLVVVGGMLWRRRRHSR